MGCWKSCARGWLKCSAAGFIAVGVAPRAPPGDCAAFALSPKGVRRPSPRSAPTFTQKGADKWVVGANGYNPYFDKLPVVYTPSPWGRPYPFTSWNWVWWDE
jgi:hypothetical protein